MSDRTAGLLIHCLNQVSLLHTSALYAYHTSYIYTPCNLYIHLTRTIHLIGKNSNQGNLNRRFNPARSGRIINGVNGTGTGDGSDGGILVMTWEEITLIDG